MGSGQWGKAGLLGKKEEAEVTLQAWQDLAIRRGKDHQRVVIEMGVGWAGATEGFRMVFSRSDSHGRDRQSLEEAEHRRQGNHGHSRRQTF